MRILVVAGWAVSLLMAAVGAHGQWEVQESHTTASLRGIHALGGGVAWASGTGGTVLKTEDGGKNWKACAVPVGAETLDFRGVQGVDGKVAVVMSSGKGEASRVYKTVDGCATWKLIYSNPDPEGFWDGIQFTSKDHGFLLGDPVLSAGESKPHIFLQETMDGGIHWKDWHDRPATLVPGGETAIFAASNSSMIASADGVVFGTGGPYRASVIGVSRHSSGICNCSPPPSPEERKHVSVSSTTQPMVFGDSAGIFSIGRNAHGMMLVGGDYKKPDSTYETAFFVSNRPSNGVPVTPPNGYRSAVAFDSSTKTWITVGPNGTDVSTDDGKNWRALKPGAGDAVDADRNWNALSLPFVVGPKGRIGVLKAGALK